MKDRAEHGRRRSDGDVNVGWEEKKSGTHACTHTKAWRRWRKSFHCDVIFIPDWTAVMKARFAGSRALKSKASSQ